VNTAIETLETFLAEVREVSPGAAGTLEIGMYATYEAADENSADQMLFDAMTWIIAQRNRPLGVRLEALRILTDHDGSPIRLRTLVGWK
jgi:hypothetical protein